MHLADAAIAAGRRDGPTSAIEILATTSDLAETIEAYRSAITSAYWKHHDLPLASAITFAGLGRLLDVSKERAGTDDDLVAARAGSSLLYNLASFTWTGWDEADIEITPEDEHRGLSAAEAHVALLDQIDADDLTRSRGIWILGAQLLSAGRYDDASERFAEAAGFARRSGSDAEAELATAFGALADLHAGDRSDESRLSAALDTLRACEDGDAYVAQVETARAVLERR